MTHGLYFSYLRDASGQPSVAIALLTSATSTQISFQIATRNKRDNFSKKIAREMSSGRLTKYPITIDMGVRDSKQSDILVAIVKYLVTKDFEGVKAGPLTRETVRAYTHLYWPPVQL